MHFLLRAGNFKSAGMHSFGSYSLIPLSWFLLTVLTFFPFCFYSQELPFQTPDGEELRSLEVNPELFRKNKKHLSFYLKADDNLIYLTDTLQLPFLDDFSFDRTKRTSNPDTVEKIHFSVDGNYKDTLTGVNYPTYMYYYNITTQQYDSSSTEQIILFYRNSNPVLSNFTFPTDTDTIWKNVTYRFNEFTVDTLTYSPDTTLVNTRDTFYIVSDDSASLWLDSLAFINRGFGINPPTIGIATFDALDASGVAYDFSPNDPYGPADRLTSKPIDLGNLTADSLVMLSFYYQPMGLGDWPDPEDSLALEFYSPADSTWNWAWSAPGITSAQAQQQPVFQLVKIAITDPKFLKKGFQFRFKNYATLTGMLDIWNIDYVYLDKNRNTSDNSVNDLAFVSIGNSFINNYTSMPMKAFKGNASQYMVPNTPVKLTNLSNATLSNDSNRYFVYDEYETIEFKESVNLQQSFTPLSQQTINHSVFSSPNNFQFTPSDSERTVFKIKFIAEQTGSDLCLFNDTVIHRQVFDSYYAYDDGSAEGIYALGNKPGVMLAYKFSIVAQDSLKGLYFYFPYIKNDVSQFTFRILLWGDNNGIPGSIIYQSNDIDNPKYSDSINEFIRYDINPPVAVNGTFYVGWQQTTVDKIYLGFDRNMNNQNKIFHTLASNNSWSNTTLAGSLMMRPDFGNAEPFAHVVKVNKKELELNVYPNPANDLIYINGTDMESEITGKYEVKIFNTLGQEILKQTITNFQSSPSINISSIPNGLYFLQVESERYGNSAMEKLLITR